MVMLLSFPILVKKKKKKKKSGKKNIVVLSTMHSSVYVIRFMITQKGVLMWLIFNLLINLHASNLPNGQ